MKQPVTINSVLRGTCETPFSTGDVADPSATHPLCKTNGTRAESRATRMQRFPRMRIYRKQVPFRPIPIRKSRHKKSQIPTTIRSNTLRTGEEHQTGIDLKSEIDPKSLKSGSGIRQRAIPTTVQTERTLARNSKFGRHTALKIRSSLVRLPQFAATVQTYSILFIDSVYGIHHSFSPILVN